MRTSKYLTIKRERERDSKAKPPPHFGIYHTTIKVNKYFLKIEVSLFSLFKESTFFLPTRISFISGSKKNKFYQIFPKIPIISISKSNPYQFPPFHFYPASFLFAFQRQVESGYCLSISHKSRRKLR